MTFRVVVIMIGFAAGALGFVGFFLDFFSHGGTALSPLIWGLISPSSQSRAILSSARTTSSASFSAPRP